jgi:hypothetical protein
MPISKLIKILLLFTSAYVVGLPCGYSEVVYNTPPVEKNKPSKKKNKKIKKKHKLWQKNLKSPTEEGPAFVLYNILYYVLFIGGILFFIFGAFSGLWWILGLCLLAISYVYGLFMIHKYDGLFMIFWVFIGLVLGNFALGLAFLIYGLIVSIPLFWIVGIVLLCLFLVFWVLTVMMTKI